MGRDYYQGSGKTPDFYVGAPYNFVPFSKAPHELSVESRVPHDAFAQEKMDGEIRYRVTARTPIFVSDGYLKKEENQYPDFARNQYGEYAIPGNTMRGLIRNNLQILSESSFTDDVDDYRLMFREVAGGADRLDKKRYSKILGASPKKVGNGKQVSILKYVKAGYITKENGKYYIYRTEQDAVGNVGGAVDKLNYYIVSERNIIDQYVDNGHRYDDFSFFFDNPEKYLQHKTHKKFQKKGQGKRTQYRNDANPEYIPYYEPVAYKVSSDGKVMSVKAISDVLPKESSNRGSGAIVEKTDFDNAAKGALKNGYRRGYVIATGPMNNKKVIYIIPEIDRTKACIDIKAVDPDAVRAYQIDYEKRKNGLKPMKAQKQKKKKGEMMQKFFDLPKEGQIKPVFYIEHEGLYFGYTPRLRLFNDYTIKDGMNEAQKKRIFDFSKSMFGYSNKETSYRSRLSFSDAVMTKEGEHARNRVSVILAEPKPSSYADYLVQKGERIINTYNTKGFELRGVKQYWLHDKPVTPEASNKDNVKSTIYPLSEETEFEGVVRFSNLSREELGLLLWSIRLESNSLVNIGQGKSFGYGVSKIDILSAKKYDRQKAYDVDGGFMLDAFADSLLDCDSLINEYKESLEKRIGMKINSDPSLSAFLLMKNESDMPNERRIRYMSVDAQNYRNRTALKDVQATVADSRTTGKRKPKG